MSFSPVSSCPVLPLLGGRDAVGVVGLSLGPAPGELAEPSKLFASRSLPSMCRMRCGRAPLCGVLRYKDNERASNACSTKPGQ